MSDYRTSGRWGRHISQHRARAGSWIAAAVLAFAATLFFGRYVADRGSKASAKTMLAVPVMLVFGVWSAREWNRLRQTRLDLHEHGFVFFDGETAHEVPWDEIRSIEGQYVPGALKRGTADEANLTMVIVDAQSGRVALPKELEGFADLRKEISDHTSAPWRSTLIANLTERG